MAELVRDLLPGPPFEVTLPPDPAGRRALERGGRVLISFSAAGGGTQALQHAVR